MSSKTKFLSKKKNDKKIKQIKNWFILFRLFQRSFTNLLYEYFSYGVCNCSLFRISFHTHTRTIWGDLFCAFLEFGVCQNLSHRHHIYASSHVFACVSSIRFYLKRFCHNLQYGTEIHHIRWRGISSPSLCEILSCISDTLAPSYSHNPSLPWRAVPGLSNAIERKGKWLKFIFPLDLIKFYFLYNFVKIQKISERL